MSRAVSCRQFMLEQLPRRRPVAAAAQARARATQRCEQSKGNNRMRCTGAGAAEEPQLFRKRQTGPPRIRDGLLVMRGA